MAKKVSGDAATTHTAEVIELHPDPEAPAEENVSDKMITLTGNTSGLKPTEHRVVVSRLPPVSLPQLYLGIYLTGNPTEQRQFAELFARAGCWRADSIDEADMVVFAGGVDVDPVLYDRVRHSSVTCDALRDLRDIQLYNKCVSDGIFMFGVCRGLQFLHVMNGGTLYQHVDNHNGDHTIYDKLNSRTISRISSVHHQLVRDDAPGMEILATARESRKRWSSASIFNTGPDEDIEAAFYRDTGCLGVQGHPEYKGYHMFSKWSMDLIQHHLIENPDFNYEGPVQRMKADVMKQNREERKKKGLPTGLTKHAVDFLDKYGPIFDKKG